MNYSYLVHFVALFFSENLENAEKPQNRAIQIINLNILIINKKIRFMHQKMQNRLPVKVTHANREKMSASMFLNPI